MDSEGKEAKLFTFKGIVFRGDNRPPKVIQKAGGFRSKNNLSDTKNIQEAQGVGIAKGATGTSGVSCADQFMAAVPAVRCADTIRIVDDEGVITGDTDRNYAVQIQTPQIFDADIIKGALSYAVTHELSLTDDSSAAKMMGVKVHTVSGDPDNIKLTVPDDLIKGAAILKSRGES